MSFGSPWGTPFYAGGGTNAGVPGRFHGAIAGRPYLFDTSDGPGWVSEDIPVQRAQADTNADPSEATLSTEALWRRTKRSYHLGAGQEHADRPESQAARYYLSSGVYPWTRNHLTLLPDTERTLTSVATEPYLAVAAGRLYVTDGQVVRYTEDLVTWTAITGNPAATALSIASDGAAVYVAYGASGVYRIAAGAGAMTSVSTGTAAAVGYAKGRLLALETSGADPRVYDISLLPAAITGGNLLLTVPNLVVTPGQWTAEAPSALYIVGVVGDRTRIWRTAVKSDGTELDPPIIAGELPDGQRARSVQGYLGEVVLIGTDDNVWVLTPDGNGNLSRRGRVEADGPVYGFEPQERFVWYGGYADATLGRLDLHSSVAEDPSTDYTPASASDLVASLSGDVRSVVTYLGKRAFTVAGRGVYVESDDKVASGTLDLGVIEYGIGDKKNVLFADVRHAPLTTGDAVTMEIATDGGVWSAVGGSSLVGAISATVSLGQRLAEAVRLRLTLAGDVDVTMVTLRVVPAPKVGEKTRLRLQLFYRQADLGGTTFLTDVLHEIAVLRNLREARTAVMVQVGAETFPAIVDRVVRFTPHSEAKDESGTWLGVWNGTLDVDVIRVEA